MSNDFADRTGVLEPTPQPDSSDFYSTTRRAGDLDDPSARSLGAPLPTNRDEQTHLGRFRLLRKLGQGGMGAVYLGEDERGGQQVALKVLSRESVPDEQAVRRFQKEARLLSEVRHPHVANLLDTGEANGTCFLVMEFVNGTDLKGLLAHAGPLTERLALQIVHDVAAALGGAHDRGIVHRDIKPGNILLAGVPVGNESATEAVFAAVAAGCKPIVKLTDFGLARHVEQSESLNMTRTGAMLGTPYYISPEQCTDRGEVRPSTDVYSLGATLFEMLAGRPPFKANDPVKLISMHCFEEPPDLRKLNASVSDGVARLVAKCLEKNPENRYADATHLLQDLDRLLRGDANDVSLHPEVPEAGGHIAEAHWEWDLAATPEQLWPLASNTERINSAVGLPAVEYTTERDAHGALKKFGSFRMGWATLKWEEHPFEWVEGRRLGVLREFQQGPFEWFLSIVELVPKAGGGTRLKHTVRIATRGVLGRLLAHIEVNVKGRRALDRIYQRMDQVATGRLKGSPALDPFVSTANLKQTVLQRFDARRDQLEQAQVDVDCADRLVQFLKESPAQELARIRPQALAARLGVDADRLTEACLQACHVGLLELHWDILCPTCRISSSVKETLAEIDRHSYCEACDLDFDVDFGNAVELIFRVHPELRQADLKTYCIGGPEHAPHVVAQARLTAGESLELDLALDAGNYVLRGPQLPYTVNIHVSHTAGTARAVLPLMPGFDPTRFPGFHAGRQLLTLENHYDRPLLVRLERTVSRKDVLTAAKASRLPLFRQLFPQEVLTRDKLSDFSACTLLAIRAVNIPELFELHGDAGAYHRLTDALRKIRETVESQGGQIVKEQDERLLAAFPEALNAVRVAVELFEIAHHEVRLQSALNRGAALSTTVNGKLDYFGRTVTAATRLLDIAEEPPLVLSAELGCDAEVQTFLSTREYRLEPVGDIHGREGRPLAVTRR